MSQHLTVRVGHLDRALTDALDAIAGLTIKVGGMEDRIRDLEAAAVNAMELFPSEAPLDTREGPTVVELMPKRRGRPRKENNG